MIETREDLLNGLQYTKGMLGRMQTLMKQHIELERRYIRKLNYEGLQQHTEQLETKSFRFQSKVALASVPATIAVFFLLISVITGNLMTAGLFIVPLVIALVGKKQPKLRLAAVAALVLNTVLFFQACSLREVAIILVLLALVVTAEVLGISWYNKVYCVRKNRKVDVYNQGVRQVTDQKNAAIAAHNDTITAQRQSIQAHCQQLRDQLLQATGDWYPPDYYTMEAVEFFLGAVRNYKAATVQEMVTAYDAHCDHAEEMAYQQAQTEKLDSIIRQNDQALKNQEEQKQLQLQTNRLLRKGNMLQFMNIVQRGACAGQQAQKMNALTREVRRTAQAVRNIPAPPSAGEVANVVIRKLAR